MSPHAYSVREFAETLLVAVLGGGLATLAGVPAGWLSGAMVFVAAAAIVGRPMDVPNPLARAVFVIMGMSIGTVVTPETLHGMTIWPLSIALLSVAMLGINAAAASYLYFVHRWIRCRPCSPPLPAVSRRSCRSPPRPVPICAASRSCNRFES
jgi:uncharacterized membrane protein AbrB (regulator of aidB expression)